MHYLNGAFAEYLLVPQRFVERNIAPDPGRPLLRARRARRAARLRAPRHRRLRASALRRAGPVEILVFGGGPIGLLFVAALARMGQSVGARRSESRPPRGRTRRSAPRARIEIARGGGQADARARERPTAARDTGSPIDCTGQPGVWSDAIESVRPGGLVNLFGGCAPGTSIPLDTHLVHYSELTLKGVYHHRPETFRRAIALLADPGFKADLLISGARPIEGVVDALRSMMRKEALKVVIQERRA